MTLLVESYTVVPLADVVPSYLYAEYADDDDLQGFVAAYNGLAQGYLDWNNQTPLGVYTNATINGPLLDWIGNGLYGITRPVLTSGSKTQRAGYNSNAYNTLPYNGNFYKNSITSSIANDDVYKRVLTWNVYRGDGQVFTLQWLKNRIARFLNGPNGTDVAVLNFPINITVSGTVFTVTDWVTDFFSALQSCYANGNLAFPFEYTLAFVNATLQNDGGVVTLNAPYLYPTSPSGLAAGSVWDNGGVVSVIPGITPNPAAPPVFFGVITAQALLALGGGNLPLSSTGLANNQLWNNGGVVSIA